MDNVFDFLDGFYADSENWNEVLPRCYAEDFFRRQAWQGADDGELLEQWYQVLMLCLYMGHADYTPGSMTAHEIVASVAWCARNVAEFSADFSHVSYYLKVLENLFAYLLEKKAVLGRNTVLEAREELLDGDRVLLMTPEGEFLPEVRYRYISDVPEADAAIFLDFGKAMEDVQEDLRHFFCRENFEPELNNATNRCVEIFYGAKDFDDLAYSQDFWQCFWDFFVFDYRLWGSLKTPIRLYAEQAVGVNKVLAEELVRTHLAVFSVLDQDGPVYFRCRNFLTHEEFSLEIPYGEKLMEQNVLVMGHLFYQDSMCMNFLQCLRINEIERRQLKQNFKRAYEKARRQYPRLTMQEWLEERPETARKIFSLFLNDDKASGRSVLQHPGYWGGGESNPGGKL